MNWQLRSRTIKFPGGKPGLTFVQVEQCNKQGLARTAGSNVWRGWHPWLPQGLTQKAANWNFGARFCLAARKASAPLDDHGWHLMLRPHASCG
eukprot:2642600-Amphidinium_carterae.1